MEATEKLTFDQVNGMFRNLIEQRIAERSQRGEVDYYTRMAIECSVYQTYMELLMSKDPTDVACKLYFIDRLFIITRFDSPNDKVGEVVREYLSESVCDISLFELKNKYPESTFVKSIKITER